MVTSKPAFKISVLAGTVMHSITSAAAKAEPLAVAAAAKSMYFSTKYGTGAAVRPADAPPVARVVIVAIYVSP